MAGSPRIPSPRQLPTPADSPISLQSDSTAFRLSPPASFSTNQLSRSSSRVVVENPEGTGAETGSGRFDSRRSSTSYSSWSTADRCVARPSTAQLELDLTTHVSYSFIPRRRASSQTSFNLLPSPVPQALPRSQSAPSQLRSFTAYSAHEGELEFDAPGE